MRNFILCLAIFFTSVAHATDEGITIAITVIVKSPDSTVEIENLKGKLEKFKGNEITKIEKALGSDDVHYISDFVIKEGKLVHITFKRKPAEKPKKS